MALGPSKHRIHEPGAATTILSLPITSTQVINTHSWIQFL